MDAPFRAAFNRAYDDALFVDYHRRLEARVGPFSFRIAETPLFVTHELRDWLARAAEEIVRELAEPATLAKLKAAIPPHYDVPGMDPLPDCVQVDFALVRGEDGRVEGRVVELQAFPSLYALETILADTWADTFEKVPGLEGPWSCFVEGDRASNVAFMKRVVVGDTDPQEVALVDFEPERQKTWPDFVATHRLFGVVPVCVTKLIKQGERLFRDSGGRLVPVRRIYNRMVFDELEAKKVIVPFSWNEPLDVTWCSHPNWYWVWSKYSLPHLSHPAVPRSRFLSDVDTKSLPEDLSGYVLKPLFSFAGAGVVVDLTHAALGRIPEAERSRWVLQEKVQYAPVISAADGADVKAEVRVMVLRHALEGPRPLRPVLFLVRTSRGKMLGVDFNRGPSKWTGGSVAIWPA